MIYRLIDELVCYGLKSQLVDAADEIYVKNRLLELFELDAYDTSDFSGEVRPVHEILEDLMKYAYENGIMEDDTITLKDLFDTKIMGILTPAPSVVQRTFADKYKDSPVEATDYYYELSQATNYIRKDRIVKDEKWVTETEYGPIDITINLSKPEKDPRDIAKAGKAKMSGYPACLLCVENEGYAGRFDHPARQNHRIVPMVLDGDDYYIQYSPYVYYNEHCIVFNAQHTPMKIERATFGKLLDFVTQFPHYFVGSNADLPIVGGSILSHDHFQGGNYTFAMAKAPIEIPVTIPGYEDVEAGIVKWPLSVLRIRHTDDKRLIELADHVLGAWRGYTDEAMMMLKADTKDKIHKLLKEKLILQNNLFQIMSPEDSADEHISYLKEVKKFTNIYDIDFRKIFARAIIKSRDEIIFVIGNPEVTKQTLKQKVLFKGTIKYKERQTWYETSFGIIINP